MRLWVLAGALLVAGGEAGAQGLESYRFKWIGANGYRLAGGMAFDPAAAGDDGLIREDAVECFFIEGYRHDRPLGRWGLAALREETTFYLEFDPRTRRFSLPSEEAPVTQGWNMDGVGDNCGAGGFGFNVGNYAQDICLDNRLIADSQIDPWTELRAVPDPGLAMPDDACRGPVLMMKR
ncbi:hypothetical protein OG2516_06037 [Oceanicola granulosus HTCC2516]|uniref:Uncharacterized protein n=2 Tax=Oceanicola granulosus TaxID=252302 RepID=Q2CAY4_OCEGH|nr:hypothetical protein OG2516_06037 [Oceanicola granulosus HTCC2516]